MKQLRILLTLTISCILAPVLDASAAHTLQVTIGAGTTQITTTVTYARQVIFQNNATHSMRVGDVNTSSTQGALLSSGSPGGSMNVGPVATSNINIASFYVNGTQNDVIDVIWVD